MGKEELREMEKKKEKDRYQKRGVSSTKEEVYQATKGLDQGLVPLAFCKIWPDILTGDPKYVLIIHGDGPGTKLSLAYLAWKEKLEIPDLWVGINQDSIIMNIDDMFCAGAEDNFLILNLLGRNAHLIPGEIVAEVIKGSQKVCDFLTSLGIFCLNTGGETADIGDLTRTLSMDHAVMTRLHRNKVINTARIEPGDIIVGFSSTGKANWELVLNSGIGSNGFTNGRHDTLAPYYRKYYETFAPETDTDLVYCGKFRLQDPLPGDKKNFTIGSALLSSTRTYAPLMKKLFEAIPRKGIHALIHCSGGGQTKIGKFGKWGLCYVKDKLFAAPPIFQMLKKVRNLPWEQMYKAYNMGHRLEAVLPREYVSSAIKVAGSCGIEAQEVGYVTSVKGLAKVVLIKSPYGEFSYTFKP